MKYCQFCGSSVSLKTPENDTLPRHTCNSCDKVYYRNPVVVAGCIPFWKGRVLLCRRAIEPGYGCWTAPGGYVESGETVEQCAQREAWEEVRVKIKLGQILSVTNVTAANQVHVFFRADMMSANFEVASECLEARLFDPKDIPWDEIAFYSVEETLRRALERDSTLFGLQRFPLNLTSLRPPRRSVST